MTSDRKRKTTAAWQRDPANQDHIRTWRRGYRKRKPEYALLSARRKNARRRGQAFELTLEDVRKMLEPMTCSVTGIKLTTDWEGPGKNPWAPSIDRCNNAVGYVPGNVRLVCWAYNLAKSEWDDEGCEMSEKRVFVIQVPARRTGPRGAWEEKFDLGPAEEFGRLVRVLDYGNVSEDPEHTLKQLRERMSDFDWELDCVLPAGDPIACARAVHFLVQELGETCFTALKWDRREGRYTPYRVG